MSYLGWIVTVSNLLLFLVCLWGVAEFGVPKLGDGLEILLLALLSSLSSLTLVARGSTAKASRSNDEKGLLALEIEARKVALRRKIKEGNIDER